MTTDLITIPTAAPEVREANDRKYGGTATHTCIVCLKGMTGVSAERGWWVHMTTSLMLAPADADVANSQGWFPVGSECAKKVPAPYRSRL